MIEPCGSTFNLSVLAIPPPAHGGGRMGSGQNTLRTADRKESGNSGSDKALAGDKKVIFTE
jgi:hypothetical protein